MIFLILFNNWGVFSFGSSEGFKYDRVYKLSLVVLLRYVEKH